MLYTAIEGDSKSVMVDILSEGEINVLKSRRIRGPSTSTSVLDDSSTHSKLSPSNAPQEPQSKAAQKNPGKRYVIVTYQVEFDKVHYPLPLFYEERKDVDTLIKTISEMKMELDFYKKHTSANTSHATE
jgi:coiled-coil domain-containing protein 61